MFDTSKSRTQVKHSVRVYAGVLLALTPSLVAQTSQPVNPGQAGDGTQPQTSTQPSAQTPGTSASTAVPAPLPPHTLRIRILNAQTNRPVADERLNVALAAAQIGSVAMATDKNGVILVKTGQATTIRILSNMYADCRPRSELYSDYPIAMVLANGITTGNLCSSARPAPKPGELLLFEIPRTYIPSAGQPPNTYLPHSDENPHAPPPP